MDTALPPTSQRRHEPQHSDATRLPNHDTVEVEEIEDNDEPPIPPAMIADGVSDDGDSDNNNNNDNNANAAAVGEDSRVAISGLEMIVDEEPGVRADGDAPLPKKPEEVVKLEQIEDDEEGPALDDPTIRSKEECKLEINETGDRIVDHELVPNIHSDEKQKVTTHLVHSVDADVEQINNARPSSSNQREVVVDEESPPIENAIEDGNNEGQLHEEVISNNSQSIEPELQAEEMTSAMGEDSSIPHITEAFLVEERSDSSPVVVDVCATPLLPWWKQRRTRILILIVVLVAVAAAVALGVMSSSSPPPPLVKTKVISATISPSVSFMPSSSSVPSMAPTSCLDRAFLRTGHTLDLPDVLYEPASNMITRFDGRNAIVAVRELDSDSVHLAFYLLTGAGDAARWVRTDYFVEELGEWSPGEWYDFVVALSGKSAFIGFPMKDTETGGAGAGVVYIYMQHEDGGSMPSSSSRWTKVPKPLVPEDGGSEGAYFGYRVHSYDDDLLIVGALHTKMIYIFQKNLHEGGQEWSQRAMLQLDYTPLAFYFVARDAILVADIDSIILNLYQYDANLGTIVTLQDPIFVRKKFIANVANMEDKLSSSDDPQAMMKGLYKTDYADIITDIAVSSSGTEGYFTFTTSKPFSGRAGWTEKGVTIYKRESRDQKFALVQYLNSSDYDDVGFGWEVAINGDLMVISGLNQSYVFSQQRDGYFEETLMLGSPYSSIQLSGRNVLLSKKLLDGEENEVLALNLEMCTPQMPTQMPSISSAPTNLHSGFPSTAPTHTLDPSSSLRPSHAPSISFAPSHCYDVTVNIVTGANTGGAITWEVYEKQTGHVFLSGGPWTGGRTYEEIMPCLQPSDYVFNITQSSGDGFEDCDSCGYAIVVDGDPVGGTGTFFYNEVLTFPVPSFDGKLDSTSERFDPCFTDFRFALSADNIPSRTWWVLSNAEGETIRSGGGYHVPKATYIENSCLPDGQYNFTIFDSRADGSAVGNYLLYVDFKKLASSDLNFGSSSTTIFQIGPHNND